MATGYSSLILRAYKLSFDDFVDAISNEFILSAADSILNIDDSGESMILTLDATMNSYKEKGYVTIRFRNSEENAITCTVRDLRGFVVEDYSMEELLTLKEENQLFQFIQKRYELLRRAGVGIGFIFDTEGYSEDYIKIDYDAWGR